MRILYWTPVFWPDIGGIELVSLKHIEHLRERNYDFVVLTSHGRVEAPDKSHYNEIPIFRFPIIQAFKTRNLSLLSDIHAQIVDIKSSFQPDLTHINFGGPAPMGYFHLKTAEISPSPVLVALHGSLSGLQSGPGTILGQVLRSAQWTTACSKAMLGDAHESIPDISRRSSAVYYGLPEPGLEPAPLSFDAPHIVCPGRMVAEKGFDIAVTAFASLVTRYPRMRITFAGDGSALTALQKQVRELHLEHAVTFIGEVSHNDVYHLINQSTLVVVPSRWREAFGLVALEAAQMKRPVVATRVGGLQEAVIDGQTGLLVEKEDSAAVAEAIDFLLNNPTTARQMGERGYVRAHDLFSWGKYIDMYDGLYRMLRESFKHEN